MVTLFLDEAGLTVQETKTRSIVKTLCWRITGSGATFLISWLISGSWTVAGSIAVVQIMANTVLYYVHERVWNAVSWGRGDPS
jgi:uncharacterized membrane protein